MGARRELDFMVAEFVMGFVWRQRKAKQESLESLPLPHDWPSGMGMRFLQSPACLLDFTDPAGADLPILPEAYGRDPPKYSDQIDAAWLVVGKLHSLGYEMILAKNSSRHVALAKSVGYYQVGVDDANYDWHCNFDTPDPSLPDRFRRGFGGEAPEAICHAALNRVSKYELNFKLSKVQ